MDRNVFFSHFFPSARVFTSFGLGTFGWIWSFETLLLLLFPPADRCSGSLVIELLLLGFFSYFGKSFHAGRRRRKHYIKQIVKWLPSIEAQCGLPDRDINGHLVAAAVAAAAWFYGLQLD